MVQEYKSSSTAKDFRISKVSNLGVSTDDHSTTPTVFSTNVGPGDSSRLTIHATEIKSGTSDTLLVLARDHTLATSALYTVDFGNSVFYTSTFSMGTGSSFSVLGFTQTSSGFFYVGQGSIFTDSSSASSDLTSQNGFLMSTAATTEATTCKQLTEDWNPSTGGTAISEDTSLSTSSFTTSSETEVDSSSTIQYQTSSYSSISQVTSHTSYDWCKQSALFELQPPADLGLGSLN